MINYEFDLKKISAETKAYLDNYEINSKHGHIRFTEKKYAINRDNLSVVAFVQDEREQTGATGYLPQNPANIAPVTGANSLKEQGR